MQKPKYTKCYVFFLMKLMGDIFPAKALWGASGHGNTGPTLGAEKSPKLISCGDYGRPLFLYIYIFILGKTHSHSAWRPSSSFQILRVPWTQAGVLSAERASPAMRPINRHSPRRSRAE